MTYCLSFACATSKAAPMAGKAGSMASMASALSAIIAAIIATNSYGPGPALLVISLCMPVPMEIDGSNCHLFMHGISGNNGRLSK
jgi:hypothetical protein